MAEAGRPVVDANGKVGMYTTQVIWPSFNNLVIGSITMSEVKDMTQGETRFNKLYKVTQSSAAKAIQLTTAGTQVLCNTVSSLMFPQHTRACSNITASAGWVTLTSAFSIREFIVTRTTIRWMSVPEMWAAIGGLWAASLFVMTFLFVSSGYTSVPHGGREVIQFRFLPNALRSRWLDKYKKDDEVLLIEIDEQRKREGVLEIELEEDLDPEARLARLEKSNAELRQRLDQMQGRLPNPVVRLC